MPKDPRADPGQPLRTTRVTPATPPLVSVIFLSFNANHLLRRAVQSVWEQAYSPIEIIIVDNASTDGTAADLAGYEDGATVVRFADNIGFARGMNAGYEASHGEYIVLCNTDVVLHPQFVAEAVALLTRHPDVGVIGPYVLRIEEEGDGRFWEWDPPRTLPLDGAVVGLTRRFLHVRSVEERDDEWRVSFKANGACPVVRRATIEDLRARFGVGPFDPIFDTYGEDVDFAFKTWSLRWRTMFARAVIAGHVRSYASAMHLWDKRGRLRVNLIAERYINGVRHLSLPQLLRVLPLGVATDGAALARQTLRGDWEAWRDVRVACARVWGMRRDLLRFRRTHRTWRTIHFPSEVYCPDSPAPPAPRPWG